MRLSRSSRTATRSRSLFALVAVTPCATTWAARPLQVSSVKWVGRARTIAISACAGGKQKLQLTLWNAEDTLALGNKLAQLCNPGDVIFLQGDYGAGKTCLARGFVRRWLSDPYEQVTSPSYLIDNVYPDPDGLAVSPGVTVHHMDLWRLPDGKVTQLVDLPAVFRDCVSLIEWPQRLGEASTPNERLEVHLAIQDVPAEAEVGGDDGRGPSNASPLAPERLDDAAGPSQEEEDCEYDDEYDDEPPPQPRVATLRAVGARWEARLEELEALAASLE